MDRSVTTIKELFEREREGTRVGDIACDIIKDSSIDLNTFLKYCIPQYGAETIYPFNKYGKYIPGVFECWQWDEEALKTITEEDMWKMLAISSTYWMLNYKRWYNAAMNKLDSLDPTKSLFTEVYSE